MRQIPGLAAAGVLGSSNMIGIFTQRVNDVDSMRSSRRCEVKNIAGLDLAAAVIDLLGNDFRDCLELHRAIFDTADPKGLVG
ncbi:hypothetical protein ABIB57_004858 [Devosia sp. UYZn731]|uniref:hypothetical protein n=1 Tax=Devosia sp. UYZn731 TaxID=3156345 RepID=UPI00339676AD